MKIKRELKIILDEKDLFVSDNLIGITDGENKKYLVYHCFSNEFKFGADTQNEIIEKLS